MAAQEYSIPNSDIWLAAEATILAYGLDAVSIVDRTITEYESQGDEVQVEAWRTVAAAVRELVNANLHTATTTLH